MARKYQEEARRRREGRREGGVEESWHWGKQGEVLWEEGRRSVNLRGRGVEEVDWGRKKEEERQKASV